MILNYYSYYKDDMAEQLNIDIKNKLSPAEDYNFLRGEGIKLIEKLSGKVWTDYNTHDPGITLLEAFCYSITDLGYRASLDIKDLLASDPDTENGLKNFLYTARQIFPCSPVTLTDYRKIVIDTDGVKNAWIEIASRYEVPIYLETVSNNTSGDIIYQLTYEASSESELVSLQGLYKVTVEYDDDVNTDTEKDVVADRIRKKLNVHRGLCEDFLSIQPVEYELFKMDAVIQVSDAFDTEKINAQVFQVIHNFFSPDVRFYSLEQMLEKGRSPEDIFEGPLLKNGFIDTEELECSERYMNIHLSDIIHLLSDIEGVIAVKKCIFPIETQSAFSDFSQWINDIKDRKKAPRLDIDNSVISFVRTSDRHRSKSEYKPDREHVKAIFQFLQSEKEPSKLRKAASDLNIPLGEPMDLATYYPLQKSLPNNYGMQERITGLDLDDSVIDSCVYELQTKETNPGSKLSDQTRTLNSITIDVFGKSLTALSSEQEKDKLKEEFKKRKLSDLTRSNRQVLQLRGFLMVFEQILADYLSQLGHVRQLFSFHMDTVQTYFPQALKEIFDLEMLLFHAGGDTRALLALMESDHVFEKRRNDMLSHLLARFGEDTDFYGGIVKRSQKEGNKSVLEGKTAFLRDYVAISSYRASGFDHKNTDQVWDTNNVSGMKKRICRLLGIKDYSTRNSTTNWIMVNKVMHKNNLERFTAVISDPENGNPLLTSNEYEYISEIHEVLDAILLRGSIRSNYDINARKDKFSYALKSKNPEENSEILATGNFEDKLALEQSFETLIRALESMASNENFHVVEHILLRPKINPQETQKATIGTTINSDAVDLMAVPDFAQAGALLRKNEDVVFYKFEITTVNDPNIDEKTVWKLSMKRGSTQVIYAEDDFIFKNHLNKRIEHIRQIATDRQNYAVEQNADGYYLFRIKDKQKVLAVSKRKYQKKEDMDLEIDSLTKFFSYEVSQLSDQLNDLSIDDNSYADPYSLQVSIFIPNWPLRFRDPSFMHLLERTIYLETPAHVYAHVYWLDYKEMTDFENVYKPWLQTIAGNDIPDTATVNNLIYVMNKLSQSN
jgi:hypothetical protein